MLDSLKYFYNGNQLIEVADGSSNNLGFYDGYQVPESDLINEVAWGYRYDANGNMKVDKNKGIDTIAYNYLNLPQTINKGADQIDYFYNARGVKLRHINVQGKVSDYIGPFVYEDGNPDYLLTSEGRLLLGGGTPSYEYYLKDHLGNTRVVYRDANNDGFIADSSEIEQVSDYYPFGMRHVPVILDKADQKYLYNGKELQDDIEMYDYGFRFYDPAIGRWNVPDPLAEYHYTYTPYNYCLNNPISYMDPFGLDTIKQKDFNMNNYKPGDNVELDEIIVLPKKPGWMKRTFRRIAAWLNSGDDSNWKKDNDYATGSTDCFTGDNPKGSDENTHSKHPGEVKNKFIGDFLTAVGVLKSSLKYSPPDDEGKIIENVTKGVTKTIKAGQNIDETVKEENTGGDETTTTGKPINSDNNGKQNNDPYFGYDSVYYMTDGELPDTMVTILRSYGILPVQKDGWVKTIEDGNYNYDKSIVVK